MFEMIVVGDTNDADYVTQASKVSQADIDKILPVIEALKAYKGNQNWPMSEYADGTPEDLYPEVDPELIELFNGYIPYGEYGIHSIESIVYYPLPEKTVLF